MTTNLKSKQQHTSTQIRKSQNVFSSNIPKPHKCRTPQQQTTLMATTNAQNSGDKTTKSFIQTSIKNEKKNFFPPKLKNLPKKITIHDEQRHWEKEV